ncbi:telomerase reverse transcriptase isoform X4 [Pyxicephalus adspersus]|uniref:telomerase reverse transcriptase isoform X4 n=1 Tax=Pyxicephalus adspersus TaxID=30357 RepID=UPI003B5BDBB6
MEQEAKSLPFVDILHALYNAVYGIVEYVEMLQMHSGETVAISQEGDTEQFRSFLTGLLVCVPWGARKPPTPISFLQTSTQREVVARVIRRICEKKKKNVLTSGYGLAEEKNSIQVLLTPNICSYYPNSTTTTVSSSVLWETLLCRVGDNIMMHLLENCSLFIAVPPTCCYQISGLPVYSQSRRDTVLPAWFKQSFTFYRSNTLFNFIQKSRKSSKLSFCKTKSWRKQTLGKIQDTRANWAKRDVHKPGTLVPTRPRNVGTSATKKCTKRSSDSDVCSIPHKKYRALPLNTLNFGFTKQTINSAVPQIRDFHNDPVYIDFGKLLYSKQVSKEGFLRTFFLNILEGNTKGSLSLIENVFLNASLFIENSHTECYFQRMNGKKLPNRYWQMRHVFKEIIQNHKKCPYSQLLKKCCDVTEKGMKVHSFTNPLLNLGCDQSDENNPCSTLKSDFKKGETVKSSSQNMVDGTTESERPTIKSVNESEVLFLLEKHNSTWQVYTFVRECLHRVVPETLWGSSHNKYRFLKNVKMLLNFAKSEKMYLSELMWKMKVEDCLWLHLKKSYHFVPASEHFLRENILAKFLYWLMDTYIIQLLKAFFYITETMFQKNKLFFYRKCIWKKLQTIGTWKHLTDVKLRLLSLDEIEYMQKKKNNSVVSTLRFIPKKNGLRPIAKMHATLEVQPRKEMVQKKIHHFNSQVKDLFSILNFERSRSPDIIGASVFGLDEIYKKWKKFVLGKQTSNVANFYFVKADVKGAYETIPHSKLKEVIMKIINPDIEEVYCIRRYAKLWIDSNGQIRKSFKQHVSTFTDFMPTMKGFLTQLQDGNIVENSIIVEQNLSLNKSSSKLLSFFQEMICNHILKIQKQILMRLSDDFLLVTTNLEQAKSFLRILAEGIPEYGCSISQHKTMVNFSTDDIPGCIGVQRLPAHTLFPWCGLQLDTQTLEVYCDYSRYSCTSIRSSLTFCHYKALGSALKSKLIKVLQLKCHGLFLDLHINRLQTVYINVYKILLLQAHRFHACVLQLPFNQRVRNNPSFYLTVISDMAPCLYIIIKAKNKGITLGTKDATGTFPFESAQWLCYNAFITKLSKHKTLYKCLLGSLQYCKKQVTSKLPVETTSLLKAVSHPSLHHDFSTIKD